MELPYNIEDFVLLICKQVLMFYCLDLRVVEWVIDLGFMEMEKKVVDLHFELELHVFRWFEGSIVVENLDKVAYIVDIENIYHKDFSIVDSKIVGEPKVPMARVDSNYFVKIVQILED